MKRVADLRLDLPSVIHAMPPAVPILGLYILIGILFLPPFVSSANAVSILFSVAALLPAVLGTQLLLVLGRFDLSIGATAALSGMVSGVCLNRYGSPTLAVLVGIVVGMVVGWGIGILVAKFHIDPLIATLAAMGILRSLSLVTNGGRIVAGLPDTFGWIANTRIADVPVLVPLVVVLAFAGATVAKHAIVFRRFYAVGNNPIAASHSGINVARLLIFGYILAGIGAATTGLIQVSRTQSASPLIFETLAIQAIAACIIGGSSLAGGRGKLLGSAIGLVVVVATNNLVVMLGISVSWQDFSVGFLLLLVVLWSPATTGLQRLVANHFRRVHP